MAKLKKIWIDNDWPVGKSIRIDWDNDRHQAVVITGDTPEDVSYALIQAGHIVKTELANGHL